MRPLLQAACEHVADQLLYTSAQVEMLMPPKNVLSDQQQVELYLAIMANPLAVATLKLVKSAEEYNRWREAMQRKASLLGMQSIRVANLSTEAKDEMQAIAQEMQQQAPEAPEGVPDVEF